MSALPRAPFTANLEKTSSRDYFRRYKAELGGWVPRQWAIHSYGCPTGEGDDGNDDLLRSFLRATKQAHATGPDPNIWITETGPRVDPLTQGRAPGNSLYEDLNTQSEKMTSQILEHCVGLDPRIRRVYLYEWFGTASEDRDKDGTIERAERRGRFDAGFTDVYRPSAEGAPRYRSRKAYCVLRERFGPAGACPEW